MTNNDIRLFMEVTKRDAEEAFRRQIEESNRRIERHMAASRVRCSEHQVMRHRRSTEDGFSE